MINNLFLINMEIKMKFENKPIKEILPILSANLIGALEQISTYYPGIEDVIDDKENPKKLSWNIPFEILNKFSNVNFKENIKMDFHLGKSYEFDLKYAEWCSENDIYYDGEYFPEVDSISVEDNDLSEVVNSFYRLYDEFRENFSPVSYDSAVNDYGDDIPF